MVKLQHSQHAIDQRNKHKNTILAELPRYISSMIHVAEYARVTEYDKDKHKCKLAPLALQSDKDKRANLIEVEVPYSLWKYDEFVDKYEKDRDEIVANIEARIGSITSTKKINDKINYKQIKKDSVVLVGFLDRDTENFNGTSKNYALKSQRIHSINDSIILEVYKP